MSADFAWRPMLASDLAAVEPLGNAIHLDHPEDAAIFAERLHLCPEGCHVLAGPTGLAGYVISHPWHANRPPPLNTLLATLPAKPDTWYIHDLALHATARGVGAGARIVGQLASLAASRGLATLSLIAVGASPPFWHRLGFRPHPLPGAKLASYGPGAAHMVCQLDRQ